MGSSSGEISSSMLREVCGTLEVRFGRRLAADEVVPLQDWKVAELGLELDALKQWAALVDPAGVPVVTAPL